MTDCVVSYLVLAKKALEHTAKTRVDCQQAVLHPALEEIPLCGKCCYDKVFDMTLFNIITSNKEHV